MKRFVFFFFFAFSFSSASHAQFGEDLAAMQRMERLERDLQLLQRQMARSETPAVSETPLSDEEITAHGGAAELGVRLSEMEEEMRALRGKMEEVDFKNRQVEENFEKFKRDTEFRFNELGQSHTAAAPLETATNTASEPKAERKPLAGNVEETTTSPAQKDTKPSATEDFPTPRDHYQHAFRLLQQTKYDEASASFADFIKKHPKDSLIGNAYYWQGESYYIRRDYVTAADQFRQGFEVLPNGQKAADNLLKLAMSLNALQRDKEACIVLGQVTTKFKKKSAAISEKAEQERARIGC